MRYEQKAELQDSNKARMYEQKKKYKYEELSEDAKITARECIDRNGGDMREISKEEFDIKKLNSFTNVWEEDGLYYEERFTATSQDWEVIDLCEQNDWYFEKNGTKKEYEW
tara:strand:+ start:137 stop:469 length:333 start_codon:yes stop_codon:yes gene_type:complete